MAEWFEPRRGGWGWNPISWQGWAITLAFIALALWTITAFEGRPGLEVAILAPAAFLLLLVSWRTCRRDGSGD